MTKLRILIVIAIAALLAVLYWFDLYQYLTLDYYQQQQVLIQELVRDNLFLSVLVFFAVYISATAISLPVAGAMALIAGALFGVVLGSVIISFASMTGATLAFLLSRFLLQDFVDRHFPKATEIINSGLNRDGAYYLFSLRLVPIFPFFVINFVMGLTHMRVWVFALVTQLGLLPITIILTNAGEQITAIASPGDILSPKLLGSLILIGVFPLLAHKLLDFMGRGKVTQ
jgi:uncharacterized membrane protein YdjX (TVP38/TMEM64 family)